MSDDLVTVVLARDQLDALTSELADNLDAVGIRAWSDTLFSGYLALVGTQLLDNEKRADA